MNLKLILNFFLIFFICSCTNAISQPVNIIDFESCVAAGNKVLRSYPPKCVASGVGTFTQKVNLPRDKIAPKVSEPLRYESGCKNTCGDGQCAEMVCQALGCPCPETNESCPKDCK